MTDKALIFGAAAALTSFVVCSSTLLYTGHIRYQDQAAASPLSRSVAAPETVAAEAENLSGPLPQEAAQAQISAKEAGDSPEAVSAALSSSDSAVMQEALTETEVVPFIAVPTEQSSYPSPVAAKPTESAAAAEESTEEETTETESTAAETTAAAPPETVSLSYHESVNQAAQEARKQPLQAFSDSSYTAGNTARDEASASSGTVTSQDMRYASFSYNDYNVILDTAIGPMMYYNQHDSHWGQYLYGGKDPITSYGCGPTTAAMLVNAFGNVSGVVTPIEMADWSASYGYYATHSGSYHDYIPAVLSAFDLMVDSVQDRSVAHVSSLLESGHVLVALMGPGALTNGGHFVIITKLRGEDRVSIADPNSFDKSTTEWPLSQILRELKKNYDAGGPLWSVRRLRN